MKYLFIFIFSHFIILFNGNAQDTIPSNWTLNGYVSNMQSVTIQKVDWISDNLIHNRINLKWTNNANTFNSVFEIRNRFFSGETVKLLPGYDKQIESDNGYLKMSKNLISEKSFLLNSKIDRAFIDYSKDKFQLRIGRQRINWAQCFTWNPNDIFNGYSFFDFDYIEHTGSDAVRLQYYANNTSTVDIAIKSDINRKTTSAIMYRFNKWNYDFQLIGGLLSEEDYVLGTGWSGNIWNASFRGEISYFQPKENFADTSGVVLVSLGSEYVFENTLSIQFEALYNQTNGNSVANFSEYYNMSMNAKNLSLSDISIMFQTSYPVSPLFNVSLACIYFPKLNGYFAGPSFSYSLSENIDFSVNAQSFEGELTKGKSEYFHLVFLRLKCNF